MLAVIVQTATPAERSSVEPGEGETAHSFLGIATNGSTDENWDGDLIIGWVLVVLLDGLGAAEGVGVDDDFQVGGRLRGRRSCCECYGSGRID